MATPPPHRLTSPAKRAAGLLLLTDLLAALCCAPRCHHCHRRTFTCAPHHAARFAQTCIDCRRFV